MSFLYATYRHDLFFITVKYHDYIPKGIQVTERTRTCIKKHRRGDNQKVLQGELSFLYMKHRHDLFYITVKYHQQFSSYKADTEMFTDGLTDARLIVISPETFSRGIKRREK